MNSNLSRHQNALRSSKNVLKIGVANMKAISENKSSLEREQIRIADFSTKIGVVRYLIEKKKILDENVKR